MPPFNRSTDFIIIHSFIYFLVAAASNAQMKSARTIEIRVVAHTQWSRLSVDCARFRLHRRCHRSKFNAYILYSLRHGPSADGALEDFYPRAIDCIFPVKLSIDHALIRTARNLNEFWICRVDAPPRRRDVHCEVASIQRHNELVEIPLALPSHNSICRISPARDARTHTNSEPATGCDWIRCTFIVACGGLYLNFIAKSFAMARKS